MLTRAGYQRRNRLDMARILGSKWTAAGRDDVLGWRHFRCTSERKLGAHRFLLLQASCAPQSKLWANAALLKDRGLWAAGWLQMSDLQERAASAPTGQECQSCAGTGFKVCQACQGTGQALIVL